MSTNSGARTVGRDEQERIGAIRRSTAAGWVAPPPTPVDMAPVLRTIAPAQSVDGWAESSAWTGVESRGARDAVSAQDRARGVNVRLIPVMSLVALLALLAAVAYSLTLAIGGWRGAPYALDRIMVFLAVLAGLGLWTVNRINRLDYQHSHSGVERLRVETAGRVAERAMEAQTAQRIEALQTALRLLDERTARQTGAGSDE